MPEHDLAKVRDAANPGKQRVPEPEVTGHIGQQQLSLNQKRGALIDSTKALKEAQRGLAEAQTAGACADAAIKSSTVKQLTGNDLKLPPVCAKYLGEGPKKD